MKRIIFIFIFSAALQTVICGQKKTPADDSLSVKADSVEAEIKNLKERVSELEKENNLRNNKKGNYKVRANWLALEKGMTKEQVVKLLGKPGNTLSGFGTYWYYPDSFGGRVEFDDDGKVTGWSEP